MKNLTFRAISIEGGKRRPAFCFLFLIGLLVSFAVHADQRDLAGLESRVHKFVLDNGLTALLVKREGAPVFSAYIRVKVGNIEEPVGSSGLAHFFEHMAFKGTPTIGVKDKNEFVNIYQRNGGTDINATTSNDYTGYFVSLPSSRLELWAYMESERLKNPIFREFDSERDVVAEERRMRYDTHPDGRLYEAYMKEAFSLSPYKNPVIGWPQDIENFDDETAKKFYETYYIPSRIVLAVVGNFNPESAKEVIQKYFGRLTKKEDSPTTILSESLERYPLQVRIVSPDDPRFYVGFYRPRYPHPDDEVLDVIEEILCEGRTSRLYQALVLRKKIVSEVACYASLPGSRLDGLFSFYAKPLAPSGNRIVHQELLSLLEQFSKIKISEAELEKVKNRVKAELLWTLKSNMGLASLLTFFESLAGDWRYLFTLQERLQEMSREDVQRVAKTYFVAGRRVSAFSDKTR